MRPVDDLVGDLLAPVGREAVQHQDIRSGPVYGLLIEPVGREHQAPIGGLLFLSHAGPDVGVQHVGSGRRRLRVAEQRRPSPGPGGDLLGPSHHLWDGLETRRRGHPDPHPSQSATQEQRVGNVVAIAQVGQGEAGQVALLLADGQQVGHALAGMLEVRQRVDDRDGGRLGQELQPLLPERPEHDDVDVARQHAPHVVDALPPSHLELVVREHHGIPSRFGHGQLEGHARSRGGLLEDQSRGPAPEALGEVPGGGLGLGRQLEHLVELLRGDVLHGKEVPAHRRRVYPGHLAGRKPVLR